MLYVITYDISEDRIRQKVAEILEGCGRRVQFSVFECRLDEQEVQRLTDRLRDSLGSADAGHLRFYRLCELCEKASYGLGEIESQDSAAVLWL